MSQSPPRNVNLNDMLHEIWFPDKTSGTAACGTHNKRVCTHKAVGDTTTFTGAQKETDIFLCVPRFATVVSRVPTGGRARPGTRYDRRCAPVHSAAAALTGRRRPCPSTPRPGGLGSMSHRG